MPGFPLKIEVDFNFCIVQYKIGYVVFDSLIRVHHPVRFRYLFIIPYAGVFPLKLKSTSIFVLYNTKLSPFSPFKAAQAPPEQPPPAGRFYLPPPFKTPVRNKKGLVFLQWQHRQTSLLFHLFLRLF